MFPVRPIKALAMLLLLLPLAELAAFLAVASITGFSVALALLVATSLAGVLLLRRLGGGTVRHLRTAGGRLEIAKINLDSRALIQGIGGILLAIPGFITGLLGVLLIVPLTRRLLAGGLRSWLRSAKSTRPRIIDLDPRDWHDTGTPTLPPGGLRSQP